MENRFGLTEEELQKLIVTRDRILYFVSIADSAVVFKRSFAGETISFGILEKGKSAITFYDRDENEQFFPILNWEIED